MNHRGFYIRRLHSITGVMPISFFMLEHIFTISRAIYGPAAFNNMVALLQSLPLLIFLEIGLIAIPISFHALYGLYLTYGSKNNALQYSYFRNWLFYLQRVTAVITLVFVIWHVWTLRVAKALYDIDINFSYMANLLADPLVFAIYVIGLTAGLFHFANGFSTFLITWGITVGPRAQAVMTYCCWGLFFLLDTIGLVALAAFV